MVYIIFCWQITLIWLQVNVENARALWMVFVQLRDFKSEHFS